jgi:hypothetical protein
MGRLGRRAIQAKPDRQDLKDRKVLQARPVSMEQLGRRAIRAKPDRQDLKDRKALQARPVSMA